MKELNNNEVDALLRSLAKRRADAPVQPRLGTGNMTVSDHLDADELNSYAEGVVPAPARARYTEHLAECDSCRGLVVSLSQSAGPVGLSAPEPRAESNFWQKLSTLFSPVVLRYAVPALMLTIVIGIGFFVMRQQQLQRQSEFIAQNKTLEPAAPTTAFDRETEKQPDTKSQPSATVSNEQTTGGFTKPQLDERQNRPVTEPEPTSAGPMLSKAPAAKDEAKAGEDDDSDVAGFAMQPKAAPAPPPAVGLRGIDKAAEVAKEAPAKREDNSLSRDGFIQRQEEHGPQRSRSNTTGSATGNANLMSQRGPSDNAKNKQNAYVETRSVAGRYFTREGNVWIDTQYDPARATIRVARGSDQFRALIADEPGIRTISEQLGGAVIVVWKGRAYRIQ